MMYPDTNLGMFVGQQQMTPFPNQCLGFQGLSMDVVQRLENGDGDVKELLTVPSILEAVRYDAPELSPKVWT